MEKNRTLKLTGLTIPAGLPQKLAPHQLLNMGSAVAAPAYRRRVELAPALHTRTQSWYKSAKCLGFVGVLDHSHT